MDVNRPRGLRKDELTTLQNVYTYIVLDWKEMLDHLVRQHLDNNK